jgi:hypothetical protein
MAEQRIGVDYPIRRGRGGYFDQTFTSIDQVKANVINVLNTSKGERLGRPQFGTRLYDIIYDSASQNIDSRVESEVRQTLDQWLPYVNIRNLVVETDGGAVKIGLQFGTTFTADETRNVTIWAESEEF